MCKKKLPKNDFTIKMKVLTPLQKLCKKLCNLAKIIVATGIEKMPKVQ